MKALGNSSITVAAKGRAVVSAEYDPAVKMTRLTTEVGETRLETWLPTHQLAELLATAFNAAASDETSIGFDTWHAKQPNPRLAHLLAGAK